MFIAEEENEVAVFRRLCHLVVRVLWCGMGVPFSGGSVMVWGGSAI